MKSSTQATPGAKVQGVKGAKSAPGKTASKAKQLSRSARKFNAETRSSVAGYSNSAARLIRRGRAAFGDAYTWAEEAGGALPKKVRNIGMPGQKSMQNFMGEKPLVLGALGLGIGVMLGSMFPAVNTSTEPKSKPVRRK
jgi:hypothetical protein